MRDPFQQSLGLMRRVVRRKIEIEQRQGAVKSLDRLTTPLSLVPDAVSFNFSLRILQRIIRRVIEQAG